MDVCGGFVRVFWIGLMWVGGLSSPAADDLKEPLVLGQLLYVNVDGFQSGGMAVHEEYIKMVAELEIGGVLPHFGVREPSAMLAAVKDLKRQVGPPLLVGIDYLELDAPLDGTPGWLGLGFGAGLIGVYGARLGPPCRAELYALQAFLHKALGLNQALGPTVDRSARFGFLNREAAQVLPPARALLAALANAHLTAVLKHYPYTPNQYSLHKEARDEPLTEAELRARTEVWSRLAPSATMIMTTHVFNSTLDEHAPVTFSPVWVERLRTTGFEGLLITDALLMMRDYGYLPEKNLLHLSDVPEIVRPDSVFAARSILAGHQMVILEGTAADTRAVYRDLALLLKHPSATGRAFAGRVAEATAAVAHYKQRHGDWLKEEIQVSPEVFQSAVVLMNRILASTHKTCNHQKAFAALERHMVYP